MSSPKPIVWTEQAAKHIESAYSYIATHTDDAIAERVIARVISAIERLATFPMSGRPGRVQNTRELVIPDLPFISAYKVQKSRIVILAIYHAAQKWPDSF